MTSVFSVVINATLCSSWPPRVGSLHKQCCQMVSTINICNKNMLRVCSRAAKELIVPSEVPVIACFYVNQLYVWLVSFFFWCERVSNEGKTTGLVWKKRNHHWSSMGVGHVWGQCFCEVWALAKSLLFFSFCPKSAVSLMCHFRE